MSFFIRNKSKGPPVGKPNKLGKRKSKGVVSVGHLKKKKKPLENTRKYSDEEIESDDEEEFETTKDFDEEEPLTAQEKKLQLAKKYLSELKKQEEEKADGGEIDSLVLNRLKEDVLEHAGKLRKRVADKIKIEITPEDIQVLRCKDHKLSITCVVVSSDSRYLYSASKDGCIVKWCLKERKKLLALPPQHKCKGRPNLHSSAVLSLAISNDGVHLASGDEGNLIQLWNADTLENIFTFKGHRAAVTGLAFCKFTHTLFSCSRDRTVKSWNIVEKGYIETLFGHQSVVTSVDVLLKDRVVTSGGVDKSVRVWKIPEESHLVFNGHKRSIDCVRRLNDQHFISCGDDGELCVWGIFRKKPLTTIKNSHGINSVSSEPNWVVCIATLSNTEVFASGSNDGFVRLWKCDDSFKGVSSLLNIPVTGFINALTFTADGQYLIAGVGQEHRLGRWCRLAEGKNSIAIVNLMKSDENLVQQSS